MGDRTSREFSLALSGGGARGIIHIGVLSALDNCNLKPSCIAGTSMGAIVGSLYANGVSPKEMLSLLSGKSFLKMFSIRPSFSGFLRMEYLKKILKEKLPKNFEELEIPFFASTTNLSKHKNVVFSTGPLQKAVMASASIPVLFEPVEIDGDVFVDGGVTENLPASACKARSQYVLAVEVNYGMFNSNLSNIKNIAMEVFQITVLNNTKSGIDSSDGLIQPELGPEFQILDFSKSKQLFDIGFKEGLEWAEKFKKNNNM